MNFNDMGSNGKYFQGAEDFFQGFGEINALFSGIKGAQGGVGGGAHKRIHFTDQWGYKNSR